MHDCITPSLSPRTALMMVLPSFSEALAALKAGKLSLLWRRMFYCGFKDGQYYETECMGLAGYALNDALDMAYQSCMPWAVYIRVEHANTSVPFAIPRERRPDEV